MTAFDDPEKTARRSGLDLFRSVYKTAPGPDPNPAPAYTSEQLQGLLTRGLAHRLTAGHIAAVVTAADLGYWIATAKAAYGKGTIEDSAGLRTFLTRRASALGLSHLIGSWSVPQTAADTGAKAPAVRAIGAQQVQVTKAAIENLARSVREADGTTEAGRAFAEAQKYERKAGQVSDPNLARGYRDLAKQRYAEAGIVR